jgi:glycerol-3-phosphate acyltransferase PlsY
MTGELIIVIALGYLLGAIPFGLMVSKLFGDVDVRAHGSGKTGAANVLRSAGKGAAAMAVAGDVTKGVAAVLFAKMLIGDDVMTLGGLRLDFQGAQVMSALAAMAGHNWSIYIKFHGGRGVACFFGGLLAMCWPIAVICGGGILMGLSILTRYVSLGSMAGAAASFLILLVLTILGYHPEQYPIEYLIYTGIAASLIVFQHRDNIGRLWSGTERRLGEKRKAP